MKRREIRRVVVALLPLLLIGLLGTRASAGESWGDWPEGKDPKTIGKRIAVNLVERPTYMVGRTGGLQRPDAVLRLLRQGPVQERVGVPAPARVTLAEGSSSDRMVWTR